MVWDAASGEPVARLADIHGRFLKTAFSPDGTRLAAGSLNERAFQLWDVDGARKLWRCELEWRYLTALAFRPDGNAIAAGTTIGSMTMWDAETGQCAARLPGARGPIDGMAFSGDGERLYVTDGAVHVLNVPR